MIVELKSVYAVFYTQIFFKVCVYYLIKGENMNIKRPKRIGNRVPVMSAPEAVQLIPNEASVAVVGAGGGILEPNTLIAALSQRYDAEQLPKDLTLVFTTGLGDRAERGICPIAKEGMVKRGIGGHWGQSPRISELAEQNKIEAYNFPQGIIAQLFRASAAHQPGLLSQIGIGTFADPRNQGCKLNEVTKEELVKLMTINGEEYIFYPTIGVDVCFLRATTCDTEGYASMEDEVLYLDALQIAQAVHNNGGIVMLQVQKMVKAGTLHPRQVKIPGYLVDVVVVDPDQQQLYDQPQPNRFVSGDYTLDADAPTNFPLNQRKLVARRALLEVKRGNVGNVGVGIADGIGLVAMEEGCHEDFILTVETGAVGGITTQGVAFGANVNTRAMLDMPAQFDFYHGGGLDVCYVSFAEVDSMGNVGVHKFNGKIMGTGGFVDICTNAKKVAFCGTLTAGGLKTDISGGKLNIVNEGRFKKFIKKLPEITFSAEAAAAKGQEVLYITERAIFHLEKGGLVLTEVAPGVDVEKDVLAHIEFRPRVASDLKLMDPRLFRPEKMGVVLPE